MVNYTDKASAWFESHVQTMIAQRLFVKTELHYDTDQ